MGKPIPFEEEVLNIGNAMNINTGKFTAPRDGIYFLTFTAERVWFPTAPASGLDIVMYLNGNRIATIRYLCIRRAVYVQGIKFG